MTRTLANSLAKTNVLIIGSEVDEIYDDDLNDLQSEDDGQLCSDSDLDSSYNQNYANSIMCSISDDYFMTL